MDLEEHPELIYGEEFCFPATTTYYPSLYAPAGINVPIRLYEHQTVLGCDNRGLHYPGHQAGGTSSMYYVVPDYGIAHSSHGPHPYAIANGRLVGGHESRADTVEHTYHQAVPTSHYAVLPSAADRTAANTAQSPAYTNGLFVPSGLGQTVAVAPERGVIWDTSVRSATVSSINFQDHTVLPKVKLHRPAPWKRRSAGGNMVPAKLPHAHQASQRSLQVAVPSVQSSPQTNRSYNNHVSNVGSDLCKMSAERSQPHAKTSSNSNQSLSFVSQQNIVKAKRPIGFMSSEIIVKSYTSRLHIGNPEGEIIIRTDQYNRDDFQVLYPNAKFFVIKSFSEADVHKSIKYGVWSTSSIGNRKLDSAFREAQAIAASSSTLCPVFLFFSVNGSSHFCGVAEMVGPVDFEKDMDFWCKDNRWIGSFPVRWHIIKNVPNYMFRSIVLQNNGYKPVTSSRDTQEIHYTPGTTMLKIFKYTRAEECLLDEFIMHEEEAMSRQHKSFKLRRGAPQFMPASRHARRTYNALLPRSDSVLMDRMISETNHLIDELRGLNLERQQGSWQEFGNLTSKASTATAEEEIQCYGKQAHESIVKATRRQAYQPVTSNTKAALDGEQYWMKVEISLSGKTHAETAACVSSEKPEYPIQEKNALVQSASGVPEMTCEEKKIIGKPCSLAINSEIREACSESLPGVVAIGSMLVPIAL